MNRMSIPATPSWVRDAICWQVYPLGFCGAPQQRDTTTPDATAPDSTAPTGQVSHRLPRLIGWLNHLVSLGANVLLLNPVFDSVTHGYDTLDHRRVDPRLGDAEDLQTLIDACHERGIRVVLDGVFNHLSVQHPVVQQALKAGPGTAEGAWIRWADGHPYGFEGNADLVELDLAHAPVQDAVAQVMIHWLERGIDGWRLDAMYAAGAAAWAPILERVRRAHPEAWLLGEVIHGDYPQIAAGSGAQSITQYELWKAIWSALHDHNLFELAHALGRHAEFLEQPGGGHPLTFLGNHDTTRIASQLPDGRDLAVAYALLALLPGVPTVYAGDELGATGIKEERAGGDDAVRPEFPDSPAEAIAGNGPLPLLSPAAAPRILEVHQRLLSLRRREPWLATARLAMDGESLSNEYARIVLHPRDEGADGVAPAPLALLLNLSDQDLPAPGEVLEAVSGAAMLDAAPAPGPGVIPAHGAAVVR